MTPPRDAYAVLQVRPDADDLVIRAAYRALARRFHFDGTDPDPARMTELNGAWEQLRAPDRRARYDAEQRVAVPVEAGRPAVVAGTPREPFDPWRHGSTAARPPAEVIDFGRYAGWRISDLARHDPDYVRWLSRHSTGVRFLEAIARCLPGDASIGRRSSFVG
jgi:curved DNA-binding protein CbpA